jgi:hypothetical protein
MPHRGRFTPLRNHHSTPEKQMRIKLMNTKSLFANKLSLGVRKAFSPNYNGYRALDNRQNSKSCPLLEGGIYCMLKRLT